MDQVTVSFVDAFLHALAPVASVVLAIALVLGTAGLPHVLMRFYTVPTAKEARR